MRCRMPGTLLGAVLVAASVPWPLTPASAQEPADAGWPYYGHDAGGMRFSPLKQINRDNVAQLKVAWIFHTSDVQNSHKDSKRSGLETTPILVDGTLYVTTAFNRVIAVDPASGKQKWAYDPKLDQSLEYGDGLVNRGVAAWLDPLRSAGQSCRRRIFEAVQDVRLIALDAATGKPCTDFGKGGQISLREVAGYIAGSYHMTSPPAIVDDQVIVGSAINDNQRVDMPAGVVRAFDARTGELRWSWDPIPPNESKGESIPSGKKWRSGAATRGRSWLWTPSAISSLYQRAALAQTITAGCGRETTNGRTRWWRCTRKPGPSRGDFNWFTTICGITTRLLRPFSRR